MDAAFRSVNITFVYSATLLRLCDYGVKLDGRSDEIDVRFKTCWDAVLVAGYVFSFCIDMLEDLRESLKGGAEARKRFQTLYLVRSKASASPTVALNRSQFDPFDNVTRSSLIP